MEKYTYPTKDFTLSGDDPTFTSAPSASLQIVLRQLDYWASNSILEPYDSMTGDNYGFSIDCDYSGRNVVIGAPNASVANSSSTIITDAGEVSIHSQAVQQFKGDGSTKGFTTQETLQTKIYVEVDGVLQTETDNADIPVDNDGSTEGFYTRAGKTITFKYSPVMVQKL